MYLTEKIRNTGAKNSCPLFTIYWVSDIVLSALYLLFHLILKSSLEVCIILPTLLNRKVSQSYPSLHSWNENWIQVSLTPKSFLLTSHTHTPACPCARLTSDLTTASALLDLRALFLSPTIFLKQHTSQNVMMDCTIQTAQNIKIPEPALSEFLKFIHIRKQKGHFVFLS